MMHNLEIRIAKDFTLEQVEALKDHIYQCIISAPEVCAGLEDVQITSEMVDLVVSDSPTQ